MWLIGGALITAGNLSKMIISSPSIIVAVKPSTSKFNHSPHSCCCRAKKLLPSNFFFQDRTSLPIERGLNLRQESDATKNNRSLHPTPRSASCPCYKFVVIEVLFVG